jgi:hypothetical protein
MNNIPHISHTLKGALLMIAGLVLFLYVTNIITSGLQMVILLSSIILMIVGFLEFDGYRKLSNLINKKK